MNQPSSVGSARTGFANLSRNFAWIIGGKGFGAVSSLIYLAVLSRSLGLKDFGHFALIFGIAQALVAITGFQTWQTLVRYGAALVPAGDWSRLGRLTWMCGAIDVLGAVVGCGVAVIIFIGFAEQLELNKNYIDIALAFSCMMMWSRMTTPIGIVRVLDRYDIGSYVEAVVPAGRLIASVIIVLTGATVTKFLVAWAFFDLLAGILYWVAAWRLVPKALHYNEFGHWRRTLGENPGIVRFFGTTLASSSLDSLYKQGPLLAVGYLLGTSAAGLYRLGDQLAQGISRFAALIPRVVFPEFAKAQSEGGLGERAFRDLARKVIIMTGCAGLAVVMVALLFGQQLTGLVGGADFASGGAILVPIAIGASFELAAVAFEPLLFSTGLALRALAVRLFSLAVLGAGILVFLPYGAVGVAWAVAVGMAAGYAAMSVIVWHVLRRKRNLG